MTDGRPSDKIGINKKKQYPFFPAIKNKQIFFLLQNESHHIFGMLAWSFWRKRSAQSSRVK